MRAYDKEFYSNAYLLSIYGASYLSKSVNMLVNGSDFSDIVFVVGALGFTFASALNVARIYPKWQELHGIAKTEEFQEYVELYKEYVKDNSRFLSELGAKGDLSGAYLYKLLLDDGFFSENREVNVGSYKNDKYDRFLDVMGARVTTGAYCCRHAASLLTDIINGMGGVAANVSVVNKSFGHMNKNQFRPDHLVTALIHNDKCAMVDPLMHKDFFPVGATPIIDERRKTVNNIKAQSLASTILLEGRSSEYSIEQNNKKNFRKIMKNPSLQLNSDMMASYTLANDIFDRNRDEIETFYNDEVPKIKKLSMYNKKFTPYSDPE